MTPSELLTQARAKIATPGTWMKGRTAALKNGKVCLATDPKAVCFCANGALWAIGIPLGIEGSVTIKLATNALDQAATEMLTIDESGLRSHIALNDRDNTTHELVLNMFDRAIIIAKGLETT
jgi:hypothetical protein